MNPKFLFRSRLTHCEPFGPLKDLVSKIKVSCERKCIDQITKNLFDVQISRILASIPTLRQISTFTYSVKVRFCQNASL